MLQPEIAQKDIDEVKKNLHVSYELNEIEKNDSAPHYTEKIKRREKTAINVQDILSNKLRAKAIYKRMKYELLLWTKETIDQMVDGRHDEFEALKQKEVTKAKVTEQIRLLLSDNDLTAEELMPNGMVDLKVKKNPRKPYRTKKRIEAESAQPQPKTEPEDATPQFSEPEGARNLPYEMGARKHTYKFHWYIFGRDYYWDGVGWVPASLRCHLSKGHTIESCILPRDEWFISKKRYSTTTPAEFLSSHEVLINEANKQGIAIKRNELNIEDAIATTEHN